MEAFLQWCNSFSTISTSPSVFEQIKKKKKKRTESIETPHERNCLLCSGGAESGQENNPFNITVKDRRQDMGFSFLNKGLWSDVLTLYHIYLQYYVRKLLHRLNLCYLTFYWCALKLQNLHSTLLFHPFTAAESGGLCMLWSQCHSRPPGGETCTRGVPQCFREGKEVCATVRGFEWQQLASEESTNHKNDHILDKKTDGETT